jgi:hypothetical protein
MAGNAFLTAGEAHFLSCGRLEVQRIFVQEADFGQIFLHFAQKGGQFRLLRYDRYVGIAGTQSHSGYQFHHFSQQSQAIYPFKLRIRVGKMSAYVPQTSGAEKSVAEGVSDDIGIGMPQQPL